MGGRAELKIDSEIPQFCDENDFINYIQFL